MLAGIHIAWPACVLPILVFDINLVYSYYGLP